MNNWRKNTKLNQTTKLTNKGKEWRNLHGKKTPKLIATEIEQPVQTLEQEPKGQQRKLFFGHIAIIFINFTAKNTLISPDFLVWKFCGKTQFPHSFGWIEVRYAETAPFRKITTPGNQVKIRCFSQFLLKI